MSTLHKALIEAQKTIPVINKGATGQVGNRKYNYAELPAILEKVMPILYKNGLSIIFRTYHITEGTILECRVFDESGAAESSSIMIPLQSDPQSTGIYITYYRRYLLANILNLSIDDDVDGDLGTGENSFTQKQKSNKEYPKSKFAYGIEASKEMTGGYFANGGQKIFKEINGCELIKIGFKYYTCPIGTYDLYKNNPSIPAYTIESLRRLNHEGMTLEEREEFDKENPF